MPATTATSAEAKVTSSPSGHTPPRCHCIQRSSNYATDLESKSPGFIVGSPSSHPKTASHTLTHESKSTVYLGWKPTEYRGCSYQNSSTCWITVRRRVPRCVLLVRPVSRAPVGLRSVRSTSTDCQATLRVSLLFGRRILAVRLITLKAKDSYVLPSSYFRQTRWPSHRAISASHNVN